MRHIVETFLLTVIASFASRPLIVITTYCITSIILLLYFHWKEKNDQLHAWIPLREQVRVLRKSSELYGSDGCGDSTRV